MTSLQQIFLRVKNISFPKKSLGVVLIGVLLFTATSIFAAAPSGGYSAGATLDPDCAPGETDCIVTTSAGVTIGGDADNSALEGVLFVDGLGDLAQDAGFTFDGTSVFVPSLVINNAFSLPTADGTVNQVLQTDGSGNVTWDTIASLTGLTENNNTFLGIDAGLNNDGVNANTFLGYLAGKFNTTGSYNTANGYSALTANTTGNFNVAIGSQSLLSNTTGIQNTGSGTQTLYSNTTGENNTATGTYALFYNTTGNSNTANGAFAMNSNTTGSSNTASGVSALYNNTTGSFNTVVGESAGYLNTTGASNAFFGYQAGNTLTTGGTNTIIGSTADTALNSTSGSIALGYGAIAATNEFALPDAIANWKFSGESYTLPVNGTLATAGVLTNDGAGALSWVAPTTGITIGDAVTGGTINQALYTDDLGNLASDANFTWDNNNLLFKVGDVGGTVNDTLFTVNDTNQSITASIGTHTAIGAVSFTGGGLDDMTSGGTYTGVGVSSTNYLIAIDSEGSPDTFSWTDDGGTTTTDNVPITGSAQTLSNGVTITFGATTGHTLTDYWEVTASSYGGQVFTNSKLAPTTNIIGADYPFIGGMIDDSANSGYGTLNGVIQIPGSTPAALMYMNNSILGTAATVQVNQMGVDLGSSDSLGYTSLGLYPMYLSLNASNNGTGDHYVYIQNNQEGDVSSGSGILLNSSVFDPVTNGYFGVVVGDVIRGGANDGYLSAGMAGDSADTAGKNFILQGGASTGTVDGGNVVIRTTRAGGVSNSTLNAYSSIGLFTPSVASFGDIDSVGNSTLFSINDATQAITFGYGIDTYTFPIGKGAAGSVLTDVAGNGTLSWAAISAEIPDQTGNSGKYLTTDGSIASWDTIASSSPISVGTNVTTLYSSGLTGTGQGETVTGGNIFLGVNAGNSATDVSYSNFFGPSTGLSAANASNSNFLGYFAGNGATDASSSNFFGQYAGYLATSASGSNFFGSHAGRSATSASGSNFFGSQAGRDALNASNSNFLGVNTGNGADNASYSNFVGFWAGTNADNASYSNFVGYGAGTSAAAAAHSIFIGYQAGYNDVVDNTISGTSILIGDNASTGGFSNSIALGKSATNDATNQFVVGSETSPITNFFIGEGVTSTTPSAFAINATGGSGTDITGASLALAGGKGTGSGAGGSLFFQTSDVLGTGTTLQSLTTKATLLASGNFGIGISPSYRFDVKHDTASYVAKFFNDGNATDHAGILVQAGVDDSTAGSTSTLIGFQDGDGGAIGAITFGSSTTNYATTSDRRLKDNITDTSLTLDVLKQIQIRDFTWIGDPTNSLSHGVIAQELYEAYPLAVSRPADETTGTWMVDYSKLMPLAIKAIQDIDLKIIGIQTLADETFLSHIRNWLADAGNGIQKIFTREIQTEKICVGTGADIECIESAQQLRDIKASLGGSYQSGGQSSGGGSQSSTPVLGCTDNTAENYDADATEDDGLCAYASDEGAGNGGAVGEPVAETTLVAEEVPAVGESAPEQQEEAPVEIAQEEPVQESESEPQEEAIIE